MERADFFAAVETLAVELDQGLAVGGQRDGVLDARDRVADPDLDRPQARVRADVPPDVRVVRDAAGLLELSDDLRVVRVVAEAGRRPRARERGEDHLPGRREPGRLAAPEGRARREREQDRQLDEEPIHDLDRLLRVVDRDMDVQPEDELAAGHVLHLVDERAVPVAGRDPLGLEEAERMRPRRPDAQRLLARDGRDVLAELAQLAVDLRCVGAHRRRDLQHRLHQLGLHLRLELVAGDRGQERVDVLHEIEDSESRSMYSSSTPSVYWSVFPKACSRTLPPSANPAVMLDG